MTTLTKKDSKFWENHFNENGRSNDEGKVNARRKIQLLKYSYMFKHLNSVPELEK
jgi:hypothetical protein